MFLTSSTTDSSKHQLRKNISVSLVISGELILALIMMTLAEKYVTMKKNPKYQRNDEQSLRRVDVNGWKVAVSVQLKHVGLPLCL